MKRRIIWSLTIALLSIVITSCSKAQVKDNQEQNIDSTAEEITEEKPTELNPTQPNRTELNPTQLNPTELNPTKNPVTTPVYELNEEGIIKPEVAKEAISEITKNVMVAISTQAFATLADYVHPEKGVRFTPYTNVSEVTDVVFSQEDIKNFFENQTKMLWGYYDGSGFEISLTPSEYYDRFIYTSDFLNAEKIGYNEVLSGGIIAENQFEVYENAIIVEYYFPGFDPNYEGLDWQSLRLVYQLYNNEWKLVGIIHNQSTI